MLVPVSVLGQAAGQATLPFLARLRAEGKSEEAGRVLHDAMALVAFLTLVASAGLVALAGPGVSAFYERGAFTAADSAATAAALVPMGLGVVFWALQALGARGFYATGDTLTPMTLATLATVISLPIYGWLAGQAGHVGLAWGTTIGMALTAGFTLYRLAGKFPYQAGRLAFGLTRSALIAGAAGLAAWAVAGAVPSSWPARVWLQLAAGGAVLGAVTLLVGRALGSPEIAMVLRRLRRKSSRN
jgi:putative peptidoglycan lipid II flippase